MPVVGIDWPQASKYCLAIGGRLPTEAEWEYDARAGSSSARYGELDAIACFGQNSGDKAHAAGGKHANQFSLYDMLGNFKPWVADDYAPYKSESQTDPLVQLADAKFKVDRSGSWGSGPNDIRASSHSGRVESYANVNLGFRSVGELSQYWRRGSRQCKPLTVCGQADRLVPKTTPKHELELIRQRLLDAGRDHRESQN